VPRPPKKPPIIGNGDEEPLEFLECIYRDQNLPANMRLRAAIAAAQYKHVKLGDAGKKQEKEKAAENAGVGRYSGMEPPRSPKAANH
jgi:phage terminase small subunit